MTATLERNVDGYVSALRRAQRDLEKSRTNTSAASDRRTELVISARQAGVSYGVIAAALGISRSAVQWIEDSHAHGTHHPDPNSNSGARPAPRNGLRENNGNQDPGN